ncbi:IclR family transcriptional regulator [Rhodovulum sulfidophilum]|uniref:HTH-type transcriptional regulator BhcR n=2 Tax=Rhodovulum sulfidophilum TaxID=35806 RepID=UPI0005A6A00D|nr:HTH-type transcriptional regulator BhcR [Rhodovulum sulfidophilum]ANB33777.1 IclR family transcriptional regulator [Rhodovulum sulfidophilum DSM 1374]ANB37599.1 IclR family transcriptional regulator [Rhodovulum sulfidophilum]MBK5922553.1 IclR family transcriptional regulator [Rhodovulum sulfidophilum]MBL3560454.1 IclR family transcriptional regulator [Rhodovulum sulfidophilum]MBL3596053.1 IclR family transcriptional regulator [Rhodovulum sulfidophilum]
MTQPRPRGRPRAFHDKTDQNTVRALDRAMGLLTALSETKGLTLSELAALSNQSPATVYRVLITLQGHDIVELEEEAQRWHVGPGAFRIGSGFLRRTNVAERSRGAMQALMRATGETANLGVEDRDEVLFLTQVETHETIRAFFSPGTRGPMHCSGIGKALLAFLPAARVAAILKTQGLPGFTPRSITSETGLHADLDRTRARGYAIDDQERAEGMRCIAAPIFNAHGEPIAGLSVSGPAFRIPLDAADGIGAEVRAAADRVTAATGGISPTEKSA